MTRISTGLVAIDAGETIVTGWVGAGGLVLSEVSAPASSPVVIEGVANFIKQRISTTSFELVLPHAGAGGTDLACAVSALIGSEKSIGTLNGRVATAIQQLNVLDANGRGLFYNLIGVTGDGDPGPGNMAFDNADPALVTELYLDVLDANAGGRDVAGLIGLWEPGTVLIVRSLASAAYAAFQLTTSPVDASGFRRVAVEPVGSDGTLAGEPVAIEWRISGSGMKIGAIGPFADRADFDDEAADFVYASVDGDGDTYTTSVLFQRRTATAGTWSAPLPFQGLKGDKGDRGWTQVFAKVPDGERRVELLVGYVLGEGVPPTAGVGLYRGLTGLVEDIADATDVRGPPGLTGTIDGLTEFMQQRVTEDFTPEDTRAALNIVLASKVEAEAGANAVKFMTPTRTAEAIAKLSPPTDTSGIERNQALLMASTAKALGGYQRFLDTVAIGFKAAGDADASSAGGTVDATAGAWKPTIAETRISTGTPTAPLGGTAANANDNNPATYVTASPGDLTGLPPASRILAKIDYGSSVTLSKIEAIGIVQSVGSGSNFSVWYSVDDTNWTQLGAAAASSTAPSNMVRNGPVLARYIAVVLIATTWAAATASVADLNGYTGVTSNATLIIPYQTADAARTKAMATFEIDPVVAITLGTDWTVEFTCDGGANWAAAATYTNCGLGQAGRSIIETEEVTCTSGTSFAARVKNLNNKQVNVHKATVRAAA